MIKLPTERRAMYRALIALSAILVTGCSSSMYEPVGPFTPVTVTKLQPGRTPFTFGSSVGNAERLVIRDVEAWQAAWASLFPPLAPIPASPNVDFGKEMIVFAAMGSRPSGGFAISVDSAATSPSGLTIWVGTLSPGSHCVLTAALTAPVDIARLPRIDGPVHFVEVPRVNDCI
ncbi:MAG: protease complex subunit PrcB family protein [Gemmatimonadaceae bacterium]